MPAPTKKRAVKKKAVNKSESKALMSPEDIKARMLAKAKQNTEYLGRGGSLRISISGKEFSLGDASLGEEINVVMLDFVNVKSFYDRDYDPNSDDKSCPACYFVGRRKEKDMEPAENSPVKQCDTCFDCEHNEFGTAKLGKGKRCGDGRRMLVSLDSDTSIEEMAILTAPGDSIKSFDKYVKGLEKFGYAPSSVITQVSFDEDKDYPKLCFSMVSEIDDIEHLTNIMEKEPEIVEIVEEGYDVSGYTPPPEKKPQIKKAARKRVRHKP